MGKHGLVVSKKLLAFIEKEFQLMIRYEGELNADRNAHRRDLERKEQTESVRIKRHGGNIGEENPNPFSTVWKTMDVKDIVLKGKAKLDFNNFVYMCDYFLRKENQEAVELEKVHRKDVHDWISRFLTSKGYRKKNGKENGKTYTSNDIRRIINTQFESHSQQEIKYVSDLFKHMFEDFCNPQPYDRFKNMTDKEAFDQIRKWNEEAKSEIAKERKS